jgi:hypothetical protein
MFEFEKVEVKGTFEPMPAGWYLAIITNLEFKPTKANNGEYLSAEFTITDAEYTGRKVFHMYNLINSNQKAVEIAMQQMKSLLIETGCDESRLKTLSKESLISLLHNKKVGIRLKIEVDKSGTYADKNVIVSYKGSGMPAPTGVIPF